MKRYRSHKVVEAAKIRYVETHGMMEARLVFEHGGALIVSAGYVGKHDPKVGGYYVRYPDGYESWSPAEAFEEGYTEVEEGAEDAPRNYRDTSAVLCCIGCWSALPFTQAGNGAHLGGTVKCCDRTYEAFFSVRSGPNLFHAGYRIIADKDGPIPESGGD